MNPNDEAMPAVMVPRSTEIVMSWLEDFAREFPDVNLVESATRADRNARHPRDNLLKFLNNSLSMLSNPKLISKGRSGVRKAPDVCYKGRDGEATTTLKHSRHILDLGKGKRVIDQALRARLRRVNSHEVEVLLDCYRLTIDFGDEAQATNEVSECVPGLAIRDT